MAELGRRHELFSPGLSDREHERWQRQHTTEQTKAEIASLKRQLADKEILLRQLYARLSEFEKESGDGAPI